MVFGKFCVYTAGPNQALIKSSGKNKVRVVIGGRILAIPVVQRVDSLSLELRTISVHTKNGTTVNGVGVDVTSCCQVKIQGWSADPISDSPTTGSGELHMDDAAIRLAAQHFIGKSDNDIESAIQKTIAGHQRAIIGVLTVEELHRDRAAFSKRVLDMCYGDMRNMGLTVVSYTVAEISDQLGYIEALGVTQLELKKREAEEGRAQHQGAAQAKRAQEEAAAHLASNKQEERKVESNMERSVLAADAQRKVDVRVAIQKKAKDITNAEQDQVLGVEKQKALAAEAKASLRVMEHEVEKQRLKMERVVHVEADAMLYKAKNEADGKRVTASAEAERIKAIGEAEAASIRAKGQADISVLRDRVLLWKECGNQAAIMEKIIDKLPEVARAIAAPLSKTDKIVFVGSGSGGGGPSQFTREMERIVAEVPETVQALTGFDMRKGLEKLISSSGSDIRNSVTQGFAEGYSSTKCANALSGA